MSHTLSYSISRKKDRKTAVIMKGNRYGCEFTLLQCRGVKICRKIPQNVSESRECLLQDGRRTGDHSLFSRKNEEYKVATQVFFWAQLNFPRRCKNVEDLTVNVRGVYEELYGKQGRVPNSRFRKGKLVSREHCRTCSVYSSRLYDFIGCEMFGKPGLCAPGCCNIEPLPADAMQMQMSKMSMKWCSTQNMDISHLRQWIHITSTVCCHLVLIQSTATVPYMGMGF